jgi:hypothetical protein
VRVKFDQADQDAAGAFRMDKDVLAARVAECVPDQLPAGAGNLRAGIVEAVHLKAGFFGNYSRPVKAILLNAPESIGKVLPLAVAAVMI